MFAINIWLVHLKSVFFRNLYPECLSAEQPSEECVRTVITYSALCSSRQLPHVVRCWLEPVAVCTHKACIMLSCCGPWAVFHWPSAIKLAFHANENMGSISVGTIEQQVTGVHSEWKKRIEPFLRVSTLCSHNSTWTKQADVKDNRLSLKLNSCLKATLVLYLIVHDYLFAQVVCSSHRLKLIFALRWECYGNTEWRREKENQGSENTANKLRPRNEQHI